jgi:hypothetical protein
VTPDFAGGYFADHPRALTFLTGALVVITGALFMRAVELDVRAYDFKAMRLGEMQRAASEALGG